MFALWICVYSSTWTGPGILHRDIKMVSLWWEGGRTDLYNRADGTLYKWCLGEYCSSARGKSPGSQRNKPVVYRVRQVFPEDELPPLSLERWRELIWGTVWIEGGREKKWHMQRHKNPGRWLQVDCYGQWRISRAQSLCLYEGHLLNLKIM